MPRRIKRVPRVQAAFDNLSPKRSLVPSRPRRPESSVLGRLEGLPPHHLAQGRAASERGLTQVAIERQGKVGVTVVKDLN